MKKVAVVWSSPNPDGLTAGYAPLTALPRVQEQNSGLHRLFWKGFACHPHRHAGCLLPEGCADRLGSPWPARDTCRDSRRPSAGMGAELAFEHTGGNAALNAIAPNGFLGDEIL